MRRAIASVLLAAAISSAGPTVVLVDGRQIEGAVATSDATTAVVVGPEGTERIPVRSLVLATAPDPKKPAGIGNPFNLYLHGGDRLRGAVTGEGATLRLDSPVVIGLRVPLDAVQAVRFGRLLGALQASYGEVFEKELERGRDTIVVQRDTRPFPIPARVLEIAAAALTARIEDEKRELDFARVYGFVRTAEAARPPPAGVQVRVHLAGGERITIPLERITAAAVEGGGVRVVRENVERLEFLGDHIAHLSDFEPIDVQQTALLGSPVPYRRDGMALGGPLRLDGRRFDRGIGATAYARLEYALGGRWETFYAVCGIDDAAGPEGDAVFRILGDGKVLAEVRRKRSDGSEALKIDVTGLDRLVLETIPGDSYVSDFCDWAEARVFNSKTGAAGAK